MAASFGELSANDESAILTNDDAASCKIWASKLGYYTDAYCKRLVPRGHENPPRRMPEISRGYWARVQAISRVVRSFIEAHSCSCQVVILGAGYDSLYWRVRDDPKKPLTPTLWIDADLSPVVVKKARAIQQNAKTTPLLFPENAPLEPLKSGSNTVDPALQPQQPAVPLLSTSSKVAFGSGNYRLASVDLNQIEKVMQTFTASVDEGGVGLDRNLPTLFVAECVLVYLQPEKCASLLGAIVAQFASPSTLIYEQCNIGRGGDDHSFGSVMLEQLSAKGIQLLGVDACASLEAQLDRLRQAGFVDTCQAKDVYSIYAKNLNANGERDRIERLEMLDEGHLLQQLLRHYCIVFGQRLGSGESGGKKLDLDATLNQVL